MIYCYVNRSFSPSLQRTQILGRCGSDAQLLWLLASGVANLDGIVHFDIIPERPHAHLTWSLRVTNGTGVSVLPMIVESPKRSSGASGQRSPIFFTRVSFQFRDRILRVQLQPGNGSACFGIHQRGSLFIRAIEIIFAPLAQRNVTRNRPRPSQSGHTYYRRFRPRLAQSPECRVWSGLAGERDYAPASLLSLKTISNVAGKIHLMDHAKHRYSFARKTFHTL